MLHQAMYRRRKSLQHRNPALTCHFRWKEEEEKVSLFIILLLSSSPLFSLPCVSRKAGNKGADTSTARDIEEVSGTQPTHRSTRAPAKLINFGASLLRMTGFPMTAF